MIEINGKFYLDAAKDDIDAGDWEEAEIYQIFPIKPYKFDYLLESKESNTKRRNILTNFDTLKISNNLVLNKTKLPKHTIYWVDKNNQIHWYGQFKYSSFDFLPRCLQLEFLWVANTFFVDSDSIFQAILKQEKLLLSPSKYKSHGESFWRNRMTTIWENGIHNIYSIDVAQRTKIKIVTYKQFSDIFSISMERHSENKNYLWLAEY